MSAHKVISTMIIIPLIKPGPLPGSIAQSVACLTADAGIPSLNPSLAT